MVEGAVVPVVLRLDVGAGIKQLFDDYNIVMVHRGVQRPEPSLDNIGQNMHRRLGECGRGGSMEATVDGCHPWGRGWGSGRGEGERDREGDPTAANPVTSPTASPTANPIAVNPANTTA